MAVENALQNQPFPAGADLSAVQYRFVKSNAQGQVIQASVAGETCIGVLQDAPGAIGRAACVAIGSRTKIILGGTVANGAPVASDAQGRAVTAATGNRILGTCTEGGAVGIVGSIIFDIGTTSP